MAFWNGKNSDDDVLTGLVSGDKPKTGTPTSSTTSTSSKTTTVGTTNPKGGPTQSATGAAPTPTDQFTTESSQDINAADLERYGKVRSALGPGTVIQGKLSFDTPVRIDGKLSGEIFSSKALIVGAQGWIDAQIDVAALIVMGTVKGNVKASEKVELRAGGRLEGDISAPAFIMNDGAIFNGGCKMQQAAKAEKVSEAAIQSAADRTSQVTAAVKGLGTAIAAGDPENSSTTKKTESKPVAPATSGHVGAR